MPLSVWVALRWPLLMRLWMMLRASLPSSLAMPIALSVPLSVPLSILCCTGALSEPREVGNPEHFPNLRKPSSLGVPASSRTESTAEPTAEPTPEATPATSL